MPRDYVRSRSRQPERSGPSGVVWLLAGVLIGLIIAGIFYIKNQRHPAPVAIPEPQSQEQTVNANIAKTPAKVPVPVKTPPTQNLQTQFDFYNVLPSKKVIGPSGEEDTTDIQSQNAANAAANNTQPPQTSNNPPSAAAKSEPQKTNTPESKTTPTAPKPLPPVIQGIPEPKPKAVIAPPPAVSHDKSSAYVVQVAALSDASDADQLKAQLTLLGFNVKVTAIQKGGKNFHRVWLGPFHSENEAKSIEKQLQENMISSKVLKSGS